jgi:hypothetical protein
LDIEADARMLSERLNICQEAIDYFRASSALLKAGVKAGLSLYEIACMCCRNDNLAEIPSMLEKLFDMAEELASVAIANERWDHTAASRALVEQLSPRRSSQRRSSMLSRVSTSTIRLPKNNEETIIELCHSSGGNASALSRALSEGRDSPALLAQSSASDSSSDAGDAGDSPEKDLCELWAAHIILDVSVDQIIPTHHRTNRSGSIVSDDGSSDSNLSSSPKGFWYIRPGSSPSVPGSDDGSVTWSPCPSPRPSPRSSIAASEFSEVPCPDFGSDDSKEFKFIKPSTVSFASIAPGPYLPPQNAVRVLPFKAEPSLGNFPVLQRSESGMSRSKSYSALSAASGPSKKSAFDGRMEFGEKYEIYRKYFHNFIDLVIVREMAAAVHNSKFGKSLSL